MFSLPKARKEQREKQAQSQSSQVSQAKQRKMRQINDLRSKMSEKRTQQYKNAMNINQEQLMEVPNDEDIAIKLINGLYISSNPNLHKHRDYDPFLSNFIKLKEYKTGDVRAQLAEEEFKRNFIVSQSYYNNGPVKKIERDRIVSQEATQHLEFGAKPKTEHERIIKSINFNQVDPIPPSDRALICNPNWREHSKQKWMDSKGFRTGMKTNFFNTAQAWQEHSVGNPQPEVYIEGSEELGTRFRARQVIKELAFKKSKQNEIQEFKMQTNPQYLHKHPNLLISGSHRTLEAQKFQQQIQDKQQGTLVKQWEQQQLRTPMHNQQTFENNRSFNQDSHHSHNVSNPIISVIKMDDDEKDNKQEVEQVKKISVLELDQTPIVVNHKVIIPPLKTKEKSMIQPIKVFVDMQLEPPNHKNYLKSMEQFIPFGFYTSALYKDHQLSNQVQMKTFGKIVQDRPLTAMTRSPMTPQSQLSFKRLPMDGEDNQSAKNKIKINLNDRPLTSQQKGRDGFSTSQGSAIKRPQTAMHSHLKLASNEYNLMTPLRPMTGMLSAKSKGTSSNKNLLEETASASSNVKDAIRKHFDKL